MSWLPILARVQFKPDAWQVKLLNIVDAEESALICAPTSSGKTFVCFYAMESILRLDSDSVIVYIAPTKAMVNQVEAEISARFSKQYKGKKSLSGVFTRDHRKNIYDCQILVTVPQCFEIMMLSMEDPTWHKKVKYVIIDEVHMVGSKGGEVWQRAILLANAPSITNKEKKHSFLYSFGTFCNCWKLGKILLLAERNQRQPKTENTLDCT